MTRLFCLGKPFPPDPRSIFSPPAATLLSGSSAPAIGRARATSYIEGNRSRASVGPFPATTDRYETHHVPLV
jgi:hypothetical protein